jgi:hypothetical protein
MQSNHLLVLPSHPIPLAPPLPINRQKEVVVLRWQEFLVLYDTTWTTDRSEGSEGDVDVQEVN